MTTWPSNNLPDETQAWRRKVEEILDQAKRDGEIARINGKATLKGQSSLRRALNQAGLDIQDSVDQIADQRRVPAAPTNPSASTDAYFDEYGYPRATVYMTVDEVDVATDGAPITTGRYEMHGRKDEAGESWVVIAEDAAIPGQTPQLKALGLPAGENWAVKMRAVSASGVAGEFSAEIKVTLAKDETPPPKPAAPSGTSRMGQVIISWLGNFVGGVASPPDLSHAEVLIATTATGTGFPFGIMEANGTYVAPEIPYGTTYWYSIVAVDFSGNRSVESDRVAVTVTPLVDTDIIGRILDGANIKLDSIQEDVIAAGAITEEKLAVDVSDKIDGAAADAAQAAIDADAASTAATDALEAADLAGDAAADALTLANQAKAGLPNRVDDPTFTFGAQNWSGSGGIFAPGGFAMGIDPATFTNIAETVERLGTTGGNAAWGGPGGVYELKLEGFYLGGTLTVTFGSASRAEDRVTKVISSQAQFVEPIRLTWGSQFIGPISVRLKMIANGTTDAIILSSVSAVDITALAAAEKAAAAAQLTADGKNSIFRSTATPTKTPLAQGDLWYVLDPANQSRVTGVKMWNGAAWGDYQLVANSVIVPGTVGSTVIQDGAVLTTKLDAEAVTAGKIAANAITAVKISAGAVTTIKLDASAVTADKIAANAITASKIEAGAIVAGKIAAGAIVADDIAANTITADEIAGNTITAANMAAGSITSGSIFANAVTTDKIDAGAITTVKLDALAVTADKIASNAITTDKLQANAITAKHTITGALIRTAASGARTEMTSSGLRVLNSSNQEIVKLGYGIATGMEVRNPATGTMFPLAPSVFGTAGVVRTNQINMVIPVSSNPSWSAFTRHNDTVDDCFVTFTAAASAYLVDFSQHWLINYVNNSSFNALVLAGLRVNGVGQSVAGARMTGSQADIRAFRPDTQFRLAQTRGSAIVYTTPGATYRLDMDFCYYGVYNVSGSGTIFLQNRYISAIPIFQ